MIQRSKAFIAMRVANLIVNGYKVASAVQTVDSAITDEDYNWEWSSRDKYGELDNRRKIRGLPRCKVNHKPVAILASVKRANLPYVIKGN